MTAQTTSTQQAYNHGSSQAHYPVIHVYGWYRAQKIIGVVATALAGDRLLPIWRLIVIEASGLVGYRLGAPRFLV